MTKTTYKTKAKINPDGTLDLHLETGLPEREVDVEVQVEVSKKLTEEEIQRAMKNGWSREFLEMLGTWEGELVRDPQGDYEVRKPFD